MCLYNVVVEFGGDIKKIIKNKTLKNFIRFCIVTPALPIPIGRSRECGPHAVQRRRLKCLGVVWDRVTYVSSKHVCIEISVGLELRRRSRCVRGDGHRALVTVVSIPATFGTCLEA